MEWVVNNMATILIFIGLGLLAIEVAVLGFSIMILFFIGLGCLLTGVLMFVGILPATLSSALLGVAILSIASAAGLWKPLKKMQNSVEPEDVTSDLIGHSFVLESDVSHTETGLHHFSGIEWKVKSEAEIAAGTEVEVVKTEVGVLTVAAKN
jgi:membrane protein implicated in regulation of membrane protease activity